MSKSNPPQTDEVLTLPEVAAKLKCSRHVIYADPKRYGGFKVGGGWRFYGARIEAIMRGDIDETGQPTKIVKGKLREIVSATSRIR